MDNLYSNKEVKYSELDRIVKKSSRFSDSGNQMEKNKNNIKYILESFVRKFDCV